jgi:ABC-type branched-subunit amino acid transport system substrate-binding protein/mono/diheme cytochrome c family protein
MAVVALCMPALAARASVTGLERGQKLFLTGDAGGSAAKAMVGPGNVSLPASSIPCASCHGRDGRGRQEGGVVAPDITGDSLMRPVRRDGPALRSRPAYTEPLLVRAITMGLDSGDNRLDPVMPRFVLSTSDAADLVAYLKQLGTAPEPGLDNGSLMLGTVLRPGGSAIQTVLAASFDEINRRGGLFGRQLVLQVTEPYDGEAFGAAVARLADAGTVFALLAPMIAGEEVAAVAAVNAAGVPTIGPLTPRVRAAPSSRYVFYLNGGLEAEASALAGFAASTFGSPGIVDDGTPLWRSVADIAATTLADARQPPKLMQPGSAELAQALAAGGAVLWFADGAMVRPAVANLSGRRPTLLLPSALAGDLLANGAPVSTFVAFATGPLDMTPEAATEFRALTQREDLPARDRSVQRQALAAAKILVEALQRAGRDVTRERLIDALETLQSYRTGLMPPVTFSPSRRIGTDGAWIVPLDGGAPTWWNR